MSKGWMPLYIGDYLADTRHLTLEQHGAYLLLIMHYWQHGGLPTDDASLRRIVFIFGSNSSRTWKRMRAAIAPLFQPGWRHKRIDKELEKAKEISMKRAVSGQKGAQLSRGRNNFERQAIAKQTGAQSHKKITTTFLTAAKEESGTTEMEPVAPPRAPSQSAGIQPSPALLNTPLVKRWGR